MIYPHYDEDSGMGINQLDLVWKEFETITDQPAGTPYPTKNDLLDAGFTDDEIDDLTCMLDDFRGSTHPLPPYIDEIPPEVVKEYIQDSIHGGWEGFRDEHKVALALMIRDLRIYAQHRTPTEEEVK